MCVCFIVCREVYKLLTTKCSIEHWMNWISDIVDKYLRIYSPVKILPLSKKSSNPMKFRVTQMKPVVLYQGLNNYY